MPSQHRRNIPANPTPIASLQRLSLTIFDQMWPSQTFRSVSGFSDTGGRRAGAFPKGQGEDASSRGLQSSIVTGPSFTISTAMLARNTPVATRPSPSTRRRCRT